ncbi:MAG: type IV toxin-antitoxin system AbiEi family antitoxin domain-containing protein, partial [bacterium]|nr:type IV toxin-antitoxin system AbiEi family antitoxin domain-containing protein [bacterium]
MGLSTEEYRKGLGKKESFLISALSRDDKLIFTTDDAKAIIGEDAKSTIYHLAKKKWILQLKKGLYIIVPLDIGVKGADSFIMHNFVIASKLAKPYYIGYWSALNHYGFSDQIPAATF